MRILHFSDVHIGVGSYDCYAQPPLTEYNEGQRNTMIREYISAAMSKAHYETLLDDGSHYGEIPDCNGVYANAATLEECRNLLEEVLEEWLLLRISRNLPIPIVNGLDLRIRESA
jgi:predicted RNase H-like HicB family nuclease